MRCHLPQEDGEKANEFCELVNTEEFPLKLDPLQGALFEKGAAKAAVEETEEAEGDMVN
jgi:hypothetical protein